MESTLKVSIILYLFSTMSLLGCVSEPKKENINKKVEIGISFTSSTGETSWLNRVALEKLRTSSLVVKANPAYNGATKEYVGLSFIDFLKLFDPSLTVSEPFWIKVTTIDGWTPPIYKSSLLIKGEALIATREKPSTLSSPISEDGLWTIVVTEKKNFYPGPFYIVWNDSGKNPDIMPLQVASIQVLTEGP